MLGFAIGGLLNVCHWLVWWATFAEEDKGWELDDAPSRDWIWTMTGLLLLCISIGNTFLTFTTTKSYQLFLAKEPVSSAHASFVAADLTLDEDVAPSETRRFLAGNPASPTPEEISVMKTVQQIEVWNPGEGQVALFMRLFSAYSPVHALTYQVGPNWLVILTIAPSLTLLLFGTVSMYISLLKDRDIIASEVMHEYNDKFVYPNIAPVKKDAATMTHEAEIVDFRWR
ncbi:hypothetical protein CALCODRAFT_506125 [Calocera cornea HHB12733]|uniref:Transmembrane protein n=1 Tax=Calocera cornea HHB12733 TaxID=1353952 RepID=A0A165J9H4_9BASI|nr:hypothetical protein CALCODRAFT_506125 [Calocera cornea HHB12733]